MKKHSPDTGYNFPTKRHYHRELYNYFDEAFQRGARFGYPAVPIKERTIVLLDSSEALETKFALDRGYKPQNIIPVNSNPAIAATITRTINGQGVAIRSFGQNIIDVIKKIKNQNRQIDIINADFCGPISEITGGCIRDICKAIKQQDRCILAITVLRGRERPGDRYYSFLKNQEERRWVDTFLKNKNISKRILSDKDYPRLGGIYYSMVRENEGAFMVPESFIFNVYSSSAGSQTMLWAAFDLWNPEIITKAIENEKEELEISEKRAALYDLESPAYAKLKDCNPFDISRLRKVSQFLHKSEQLNKRSLSILDNIKLLLEKQIELFS